MPKYLLLKHYRGGPDPLDTDVPFDQWTPEEFDAHVAFMHDFAASLETTGEFVDGQALSPDGMWVRSDGEGRPPVTDGPFAETKDLIAGWMIIDVDTEATATTVRTRGGEALVTDGPFAETKEAFFSYILIDVADLDEALRWAKRMPNVTYGSVEIRPLSSLDQDA